MKRRSRLNARSILAGTIAAGTLQALLATAAIWVLVIAASGHPTAAQSLDRLAGLY